MKRYKRFYQMFTVAYFIIILDIEYVISYNEGFAIWYSRVLSNNGAFTNTNRTFFTFKYANETHVDIVVPEKVSNNVWN